MHVHRIVVADDHPIIHRAVRDAVPKGFVVVAECTDATSAFEAIRTHAAHLVVLDPRLRGDGLSLLMRLRALRIPVRILVLSAEAESTGGVRARRAGADGFVPKTATRADLALAIELVARGKRHFRSGPAAGPGADYDDDALLGSLNDREFGVLKGLAAGRSNGEISVDLALTPKCVSACRNKLMRKLGMPSIPALIAFARFNHVLHD